MSSGSDELSESVSWCKQKCKSSGSSFYPAFRLLDQPRREAMYTLYAFARITDDLGDSDEEVQTRRRKLSRWRELTSKVLADSPIASDPAAQSEEYPALWAGLRFNVERYGLPALHFDELIEGVMMDLDHTQPVDWPETEAYCYHVATTVGLLCTYIWRQDSRVKPDEKLAHHCGIAFQLTNILRDIAEDARLGRIYLPSEALEQHGIDRDAWLAGTPDGGWKELVESVANRAEQAYSSGWEVSRRLSPGGKSMFNLMWSSYRQLLRNVVRNKDQLWVGPRTRLSKPQ
ncbi:MAG TPA: hypothetical protein DDW52_11265, partial [Planctomycetaceae bacterium]|nr:hypothetical protein [Planctomycetaceae bacterium]